MCRKQGDHKLVIVKAGGWTQGTPCIVPSVTRSQILHNKKFHFKGQKTIFANVPVKAELEQTGAIGHVYVSC